MYLEAKITALVMRHPDIPADCKAEAAKKALDLFNHGPMDPSDCGHGSRKSESAVAQVAVAYSFDGYLKSLEEFTSQSGGVYPATRDIQPEQKKYEDIPISEIKTLHRWANYFSDALERHNL